MQPALNRELLAGKETARGRHEHGARRHSRFCTTSTVDTLPEMPDEVRWDHRRSVRQRCEPMVAERLPEGQPEPHTGLPAWLFRSTDAGRGPVPHGAGLCPGFRRVLLRRAAASRSVRLTEGPGDDQTLTPPGVEECGRSRTPSAGAPRKSCTRD